MKSALILMAHGSQNPAWLAPFQGMVKELQKEKGDFIHLAFLEMASPTLREAAIYLSQKGATHIQVLPLFMSAGGHLKKDIPEQISSILKELPSLKMDLLPHVGSHPKFFEMLKAIALEYAQNLCLDS